jgi:hypothetical protein
MQLASGIVHTKLREVLSHMSLAYIKSWLQVKAKTWLVPSLGTWFNIHNSSFFNLLLMILSYAQLLQTICPQ